MDVLALLDAIEHDDINAFACSYQLIRAKLPGHEAIFARYWRTTRGVLRAELGYELAKRGVISASALPALSLERATRALARCHLCGPRDIIYTSQLADLRRLYGERDIARGVIQASLAEGWLGMALTQWFELVWPHASPAERVQLLFKVGQVELLSWYVARFAAHGLEPTTRQEMESQLARLLPIKPTPNMFLPDTRPYAPYTCLLAAMLLIQDASRRQVGLGPVGGSTFARAIELSELFPQQCGLSPALIKLLQTLFGETPQG